MKTILLRTIISFITLSLAHAANAQKQACNAYSYNYKLGVKSIYGYLLKGDNFEYFSDNRRHEMVFINKSIFRSKSRLEVIPVLRTDIDSMQYYQSSKPIYSIFKPTYQQFSAFLFYEKTLVELLISSPQEAKGSAIPVNFGVESSIDIKKLLETFNANDICLFYDATARTYSYIKDNQYFFWNYDVKRFSKVDGIDGYRHFVGR